MSVFQDPAETRDYVLREQRRDEGEEVDADVEAKKDRERVTWQLGRPNVREYGVLQDLVRSDGSITSPGTYQRLLLRYGLKGMRVAPDVGAPPWAVGDDGYVTEDFLNRLSVGARRELATAIDRFLEFGEPDAAKSQ